MTCPNCYVKLKVMDVVNNVDDNEVYRQQKCPCCDRYFYSIETEIKPGRDFLSKWRKYHRANFKT